MGAIPVEECTSELGGTIYDRGRSMRGAGNSPTPSRASPARRALLAGNYNNAS